jgi:hypothetical protein
MIKTKVHSCFGDSVIEHWNLFDYWLLIIGVYKLPLGNLFPPFSTIVKELVCEWDN